MGEALLPWESLRILTSIVDIALPVGLEKQLAESQIPPISASQTLNNMVSQLPVECRNGFSILHGEKILLGTVFQC